MSRWWLIALGLTGVAMADPNAGLVARYEFEAAEQGVVRDLSGQGNDLKLEGTAKLGPGKIGQGLVLDGQGFARAPRSDSLELGGEMTLEAWIRPSRHLPSGMRILDRASIGGNDGFMLDTWPNGHLRLISAASFLRAAPDLPVGQWLHVAATCSEATGESALYLNGEPVVDGAAGGRLKPSAHPLTIGANSAGGDRFEGVIDGVRIYRRALSADEIHAHAEGREIEALAATGAAPLPVMTRDDRPAVDHSALLAHNDLVYLQPARYPYEAMHLGNGDLGVTQWNAGGLTWQLTNSSYRLGWEAVSSGRVTLSTPALAKAKPKAFEQRQRLWDGEVTTHTETPAGTSDVVSFVAEGFADTLVIHVRESVPAPRELALHLWPSRRDAKFIVGADFIALTEHADHAEPWMPDNQAVVVAVDGAQVKPGRRDERTLTLTLDPRATEFTVYVANPLARGPQESALPLARGALDRLRARDWQALRTEHQAFWHTFWPRSFVHLASANGEAELVENAYDLFLYDLAAMGRTALLPPKFNGGSFLVDGDMRHWGGGYWHQNTRELFWPVYAAGHPELSDTFFDLYRRCLPKAEERARISYGAAGAVLPEWTTPDGGGAAKPPLTPGYQAHLVTVGLEVALQAWWRYQFTGDERILSETLYPLLESALAFYVTYAKRDAYGVYHIEPANAQETYWAVRDPHQDLAALRWAIPVALDLSRKLGRDRDMRPLWQDLLDHLAPYPVDPVKHVLRAADLKPTDEPHNSENVEDYGIFPFGMFGLGLPDYELARNTFEHRFVPGMGNGWEPAAIAAARLGLADQAAGLELAHLRSNLRSNNGTWYSPTTSVFVASIPDSPYYDAPGVSATALQEMLLQSHNGLLRLAPAWPQRWQAQYRLYARGGFVVTAEVGAGQVRYALIESQRGEPCRLVNPWPGEAVITRGGQPVLRSADRELKFDTRAGAVYRVEAAGTPLAGQAFDRLAPPPATGPRFIGRRLPPWPNWNAPGYLGIDAEGRTPQRATMLRNVDDLAKRVGAATAGLTDVSTGKAQTAVITAKGSQAAPALVDGLTGPGSRVEVPNGQSFTLDLGAVMPVRALLFSRDRTALYVDGTAIGYTWEASTDGATWTMLVDAAKRRSTPVGQLDAVAATPARYLRLKVTGEYGQAVVLDEVTVWAEAAKAQAPTPR